MIETILILAFVTIATLLGRISQHLRALGRWARAQAELNKRRADLAQQELVELQVNTAAINELIYTIDAATEPRLMIIDPKKDRN